jgi:hypothetical protein
MQKELQVKKNYAAVGEDIGPELGASFIESYGDAYPGEVKHFSIGKSILEQTLAQPGCAGIRMYNALNEKGQKTLVCVGIDEAGNDIVKRVVVQEDGEVIRMNGIVADRQDDGFSWLGWLFGM